MPNEKQDLMNHRQTALACKNYTDKEIKASEERILSIVARNNVDFIDHINEPTYRFTAPANAKLLMLQSVGGNSVKYSPSVASDNNATHIKTLPSTVYDFDVSKVEGVGYKVNQFADCVNTTLSQPGNIISSKLFTYNPNHKYLGVYDYSIETEATDVIFLFGIWDNNMSNYLRRSFATSTLSDKNIFLVTSRSWFPEGSLTDFESVKVVVQVVRNVTSSNKVTTSNVQFFDLTDMGIDTTDVSTAISELAKRNIYLDTYEPYNLGSIRNNAFTGVKVEGSNLRNLPNNTLSQQGAIINRTLVNLPRGTYYISFDWTGGGDMAIICENSSLQIINTLTLSGLSSGRNGGTFTITQEAVYIRGYSNNSSGGTISNIMLNNGSTAMSYVPYIQPTTIPIDLTTIKDSNNVSLFPSGKMMGNSNVADFITPYNQESRWNTVDLSSFTWNLQEGEDYWYFRAVWVGGGQKIYPSGATIRDGVHNVYSASNQSNIGIYDNEFSWTTNNILVRTNSKTITPSGILQFARETPLTSNTDLTSLTRINAQSNGTITLNNTDNVDMPNLISYNAIIRHALATAVKQEGANKFDISKVLINSTVSINENTIIKKAGAYNYDIFTGTTASSTPVSDLSEIMYLKAGTYTLSFVSSSIGILNAVKVNSDGTINSNVGTSFTLTEDSYITLRVQSYDAVTISDVMLNEGSTALSYRPYKAPITRLLPNSEAKYSWGITNGVRNTRVFCDDECNPVNEGSLVVGNNDLGSDNWGKTSVFYTNINGLKDGAKGLCNKFPVVSFEEVSPNEDFIQTRTNSQIYFRYVSGSIYESMTDSEFKTAMNGEILWYQKNATDTETLDDFDSSFDCEEGDTFTIIGCELLQCYATYSFLIKEAKSNE